MAKRKSSITLRGDAARMFGKALMASNPKSPERDTTKPEPDPRSCFPALPLVVQWTKEDNERSFKQGWGIFWSDGPPQRLEICKVDEMDVFKTDDEVLLWLIESCETNPVAAKALVYCLLVDPNWLAADFSDMKNVKVLNIHGNLARTWSRVVRRREDVHDEKFLRMSILLASLKGTIHKDASRAAIDGILQDAASSLSHLATLEMDRYGGWKIQRHETHQSDQH